MLGTHSLLPMLISEQKRGRPAGGGGAGCLEAESTPNSIFGGAFEAARAE